MMFIDVFLKINFYSKSSERERLLKCQREINVTTISGKDIERNAYS